MMSKQWPFQLDPPEPDCLRLSPEKRLCSKFDPVSIALFPVADPGEMGMRVLDDCAEEHRM